MAFLDPREGDLEDDASSTSRHTPLRHAGRMLLEVSLPKLALAFVLLVVLPGLLLGGAPILAVLFAQEVWRRMPEAAHLLSLLAVAGGAALVAWRWGPALFRLAERSFWALGAVLVQPLFTAVREAARQALEAALRGRIAARGPAALTRVRRLAGCWPAPCSRSAPRRSCCGSGRCPGSSCRTSARPRGWPRQCGTRWPTACCSLRST